MNTSQKASELCGYSEFRGVFACDKIPTFVRGGIVINTDPSNRRGEHWVALYLGGNGRGEYFDSFGLPPIVEQIIQSIARNCPQGCTFNSIAIQRATSETCGRFCISFLKCKFNGESFQRIISTFNSTEEAALKRLTQCGELIPLSNHK